jgi:putative restriction endonuclease
MDISPATITRIEKAAVDNGFDQDLLRERDWLGFASTQCPLRIWLRSAGDTSVHAAFSQQNVARALDQYGMPMAAPLPKGAIGGRTVADIPSLHYLLRRAFQLSKTLPDELLHSFEKQIATLPRTTEIERLVVQRVGQDIFRRGLLDYWEGRCAITGLAVPEMLRASHIKPWADCDSDAERLDVFNGFLFSPNLDAAFDRGFITVADDGSVIVSGMLDVAARHALGLDAALRVRTRLLHDAHQNYMSWHRERVFQHGGGNG